VNFNSLTIVGNVTRDPEVRTTASGKTVANFSVAVNNKIGGKESTDYFRVTAWERQAEIVEQYVRKGSLVMITGRVTLDEYENKEGVKHASMVVTASTLTLGPRRDNDDRERGGEREERRGGNVMDERRRQPAPADNRRAPEGEEPIDGSEDDLPF
jgi:single-strand DNA-binding protein